MRGVEGGRKGSKKARLGPLRPTSTITRIHTLRAAVEVVAQAPSCIPGWRCCVRCNAVRSGAGAWGTASAAAEGGGHEGRNQGDPLLRRGRPVRERFGCTTPEQRA